MSCDLALCIQLALSRHPDLQVAEARRLAAQSKLEFEKSQWKPHLDIKGESGYLTGKAVSPFAVLSGVTEEGIRQREVSGGYYTGSLSLSVPIVKEGRLLGLNSPSISQARSSLAVEESQQISRRAQVIHQVTAAFIDMLKAMEMVKTQDRVVRLAESQSRLALTQFKQDLIARRDLLLADVHLAAAKRDLLVFRNALDQAKGVLARAVGLEAPTLLEIRDTPVPAPQASALPPFDELLAFAYEHRPELQAQQAQIEARQAEVKRLRGERFPSLELVTEYSLGDDFDSRRNSQWKTAAQLSGTIFDFGRHERKVGISRALVTEEVKKLESLRGVIAGQVQDVYTQMSNTRAQLDLSDKQIEQATEALKLSRARFEQQLLPESAVTEAQIMLLKLEQAKVLAAYDLTLAYSQLELVTGGWKAQAP